MSEVWQDWEKLVTEANNTSISLAKRLEASEATVARLTAALEQAKVDFRLVQKDSERDDDEYVQQDVYNDAVFALGRLDAALASARSQATE